MKKPLIVLSILALAVVGVVSLLAAEAPTKLAKELEPLRPLLGKTWKGAMEPGSDGQPTYDVARWERALNGQAVRLLHSVNQGAYGGETIFIWNRKTKQVEYRYYTTAGFFTEGVATLADGKIQTTEQVTGESTGITQVKGTSELLSDGRLQVKTQYLRDGKWEDGRNTIYVEAPGAEVIFK